MRNGFAMSAALLAALLCPIPDVFVKAPAAQPILPERSLLIMEPAVVSPGLAGGTCKLQPASGTWSFGSLMTDIAGGDKVAGKALVTDWLAQYDTAQTVGDREIAQPRPEVKQYIGQQWTPNHDLDQLPFRLLAIVNRIDLRDSPLITGENGGELRFVFGAVSPAPDCNDLPFGVILEFGVRVSSCDDLAYWAHGWIELSKIDPKMQTSLFVDQLKQLIDSRVAAASVLAKPNGSALDHVRTDENLAGTNVEMREFRLSPASGRLMEDTVTLTPADSLNNSPDLTKFLNRIASGIQGEDYWVPLFQPETVNTLQPATVNTPLLGATALPRSVPSGQTFWGAPGFNGDLSIFSNNTCSGCHSRDDANTDFTQVDPAPPAHGSGYGRASKFLMNDVHTNRCPLLCRASAPNGNACGPGEDFSDECNERCGISAQARTKRPLVH